VDLRERSGGGLRHPWETARIVAIEAIVRRLGIEWPRVLDVGCGDGYLVGELHRRLGFREVVGQDINLTDELIIELSQPGVRLVRQLDELSYRADVMLLLDVFEHVESPASWLERLVDERLADGGRVVITVPAFQSLFTEHDRALEHVRRFSRGELLDEIARAGLVALESGYLFASLLLPRSLAVLRERVWPRQVRPAQTGLGAWRGSERMNHLLHRALVLDNELCLAAHARGVIVPGLTVWLTCRTRS
jgi:trans-aconitate methyltransferase